MEQIHIKVDADTKYNWNRYADENPQFGNLSQLIRYSVQQEIEDQPDESDSTNSDADLIDLLHSIHQSIEQVNNNVIAADEKSIDIDDLEENTNQVVDAVKYYMKEDEVFRRDAYEHAADSPAVVRETVERIREQIIQQFDSRIDTINGEETSLNQFLDEDEIHA